MCSLVFSIQEFLKLVPGLAIFPFSLYFAWKKVGNKVAASISTSHETTLAPRIREVVVRNMKDKPLTVFAIYAVVNEDVYFQVEKFEPPITVKPLESVQIETRPYSRLSIGEGKFEPAFMPPENIELYLVLARKAVKCKMMSHPDAATFSTFRSIASLRKKRPSLTTSCTTTTLRSQLPTVLTL